MEKRGLVRHLTCLSVLAHLVCLARDEKANDEAKEAQDRAKDFDDENLDEAGSRVSDGPGEG